MQVPMRFYCDSFENYTPFVSFENQLTDMFNKALGKGWSIFVASLVYIIYTQQAWRGVLANIF